MAAYAAVVSLMNTLLNIEDNHRFSNSLDKKQIHTLRKKLDFLLEFIETTTTTTTHSQSDEAQLVLESQIASAAFAAEDVIESHIVDQIHTGLLSLLNLQTIIQDMDYVEEKVATAKEQRGFKDVQQPTHTTSSSTSSTPPATKSKMVGFDDKLIRLLDELTGHQSTLEIISIDGMGGIGKTTLARNVYENSLIVHHFDIRAWVTVSQQYSVRDIFSKLLSCYLNGEFDQETENRLAERLYKSLIGRRYLIVLDDIWSLEAWYAIRRFFPNNNNRSRVIVTTRLSNIATQLGTSPFRLGFLDEDKSWELFCENAFPGGGCSAEAEEIGKKIAKKCKGLPLLLVVIGALLRKTSMDYWGNISENIHSILNSGDNKSLDILSLSYSHLPAHLKPCFLYMGTLADDHEIVVSELINLWVAEGFIKSSKILNSEEVARGYLKDLVDRNLILNCKMKRPDVEIEYCSTHDLLRDLCLEKAQRENFLCVMRVSNIRQGIDTERCFVSNQGLVSKPSYQDEHLNTVESAFLARSADSMSSIKFKMLRVLNAPYSYYCVDDVLEQVNLRHISIFGAVQNSRDLYSSISLLWNLQSLTITSWVKMVAPLEIWEMPLLRHVNIYALCLPDPPVSNRQNYEFVLRNLQTLDAPLNLNLTEEVCKRIPNVKRFAVIYDDDHAKRITSYDFGRLHKLESLNCQFYRMPRRVDFLHNLKFPSSLQNLILKCCGFRWEDLTIIGLLPHLRVLKLDRFSAIGSEWNPVEGEFLRLRFLELRYNNLIDWNADNSHFPVLEKLVLDGLRNLKEIPFGLGKIPTLVDVILFDCSESSSISAVKILDEQESFGNDSLRVQIRVEELERFKEKIKQFESSTSKHLQLLSEPERKM